MDNSYNNFFNIKTPNKGYHVHNGTVDLYYSKDLSFNCACGKSHKANDVQAIIEFPLENKVIYICPLDEFQFVIVRPTGLFSIKGLKTIAAYRAKNEQELLDIMQDLEKRKKRN